MALKLRTERIRIVANGTRCAHCGRKFDEDDMAFVDQSHNRFCKVQHAEAFHKVRQ